MLHQPSGADANYDQLDLAASLRAQSLQQEARIKIEERKAQLYETTMYRRSCCTRAHAHCFSVSSLTPCLWPRFLPLCSSELESEKRSSAAKLDTLQRMVASLVQQGSQLKEDINTGEQFATCFTMRSLADHADEETDFRHDAEQRQRTAELVSQRAKQAQEALRNLGNRRALAAIREELASDSEPHLAMYERSCGVILELASKALDSERQETGGAEQDAAMMQVDKQPSLAEPSLAEPSLAERLHGACLSHVARGEDDSVKLADLANAQIGRLSGLTTRPKLYAQVEAELAAPATSDADGGQETVAGRDDDKCGADGHGEGVERRTAEEEGTAPEPGCAMQVDTCQWGERHAA